MATIAKVSNGASASSALNYALGKDKELHNDTNQWLEDNRLERPPELANCRAVAVGGTNGVDPFIAKDQFKAVRQAFGQDKRCNQILRIIQSFALSELDPTNPSDWQRANDLGCELAEKLYPQYQCAVYTQIDGKNHVIHNHINVNKVNLETGKKLDERKGVAVERARTANDEIAHEQGWKVIPPVWEHKSKTEQELTKKGQYSYMADLRSRIDSVMTDTAVSDFKTFSERLEKSGVNVSVRGKNVSYFFLDANSKQRRARGKRLGADYDKEGINNELEIRSRKQATQAREPIFERTIERTNEIERNYLKSEQDYKDAQTRKQQAEADDTKLSVFRNLMGQLEEKYRDFVEFFKKYRKNSLMYDLYGDKGMKQKAMKAFEYRDKSSYHAEKTKKTKEQEPYTLQFNSKLIGPDDFVTVNPKTKTIGIGNSRGSNIKKIPEKTTILKRKELKDEIERLSGSYHVLNDIYGHEKGSLNEINAFNDELPINAILENPKPAKKQQAQQQQAKKKPAHRHVSHRLQIKHPNQQKQQQKRGRGPSL
jgi:hypothetical protein